MAGCMNLGGVPRAFLTTLLGVSFTEPLSDGKVRDRDITFLSEKLRKSSTGAAQPSSKESREHRAQNGQEVENQEQKGKLGDDEDSSSRSPSQDRRMETLGLLDATRADVEKKGKTTDGFSTERIPSTSTVSEDGKGSSTGNRRQEREEHRPSMEMGS